MKFLNVPRKNLEYQGQPGPYWYLAKLPDGRFAAHAVCPDGHNLDVSRHTVLSTGRLTPIVGCKDCKFRGSMRLLGWTKVQSRK